MKMSLKVLSSFLFINLLGSYLLTHLLPESLLIVLGYLYSSQARHQLQPSNARAVLAAAVFLGQQGLHVPRCSFGLF